MKTSTSLHVIIDAVPTPLQMLAQRWWNTPSGCREQVQIQWSDDSKWDVTREDKLELQERYPETLSWCQSKTQGREDVSNYTAAKDSNGLGHHQWRLVRSIQPNWRHVSPKLTKWPSSVSSHI
jgi:hypothetical protein